MPFSKSNVDGKGKKAARPKSGNICCEPCPFQTQECKDDFDMVMALEELTAQKVKQGGKEIRM